ncbi:helix-turn-helix transcriptional regulator [Streptomyces coeruleorubidus]|uniref:helix-turn-helix transcriptional regulator n=1 Tax=Streptomyces coeruleorubidus TaxID=116188 RepID=UPI00365E92FF
MSKKPAQPTLAEVRKWPATVSVTDAARAIGCSRSHLYERVKRGDSPVKTIDVGTRHVVITADLVRLLSGGIETGGAAA